MARWYQTPEFLALRKEWYDKLEEDGFQDTEAVHWINGESSHLMPSHVVTRFTLQHRYGPRRTMEQIEEFFRLARHHTHVLAEEDHPDEMLKAWALFADEGLSSREIARRMGYSQHHKFRREVSKFVKAQEKRIQESIKETPTDKGPTDS